MDDLVLVTGATGFIGSRVVHALASSGFKNLRCVARSEKRAAALSDRYAGLDVRVGDLTSSAFTQQVVDGVRVIFHLAAGFDKSFAGAFLNSAITTRNLAAASLTTGALRRFVCVSSFAVYSNFRMRRGALLDESAPLEDAPQERFDAYAFGKLKQEAVLREYAARTSLPFVILRPGTVFGPGKRDLTGRIGIDTFGIFLHIGGSNLLPLTYVDNCAEAIVLCGFVPGIDGETFNVVDDDLLTSRQFLRMVRRRATPFRSVSMPYPVAYGLSLLWESYSRWSRGHLPPSFNRRRCAAEWKGNRFTNSRLRSLTGWQPRVGLEEATRKFLAQFDQ